MHTKEKPLQSAHLTDLNQDKNYDPVCTVHAINYEIALVLSRRYRCVGVIDQRGKSSFGLFLSALVFETMTRFDSWMGHKELWIYLLLICFVKITGYVSGEGDVRSVTIWWQWWFLGFLNAWWIPHWIEWPTDKSNELRQEDVSSVKGRSNVTKV